MRRAATTCHHIGWGAPYARKLVGGQTPRKERLKRGYRQKNILGKNWLGANPLQETVEEESGLSLNKDFQFFLDLFSNSIGWESGGRG